MPKKNKPHRSVGKRIVLIAIVAVLIGLLGAVLAYNRQLQPVSSQSEEVLFTVASGASANQVIEDLEEAGLIRSSWATRISVRLSGLTQVKAGTYQLDRSWDVRQIFEVLNDSRGALSEDIRLTFVEGDWAKHIAEKIEERIIDGREREGAGRMGGTSRDAEPKIHESRRRDRGRARRQVPG